MPRKRQPFTSTDAWIAAGIAATSLALAAAVLASAERVKRDQAELIVKAIAAANRKRQAAGKPAVMGRVDDASALVADGDLEAQEWDNLPYVFSGAEKARDACILAMAKRRTDGPQGAVKTPYDQWGVCAAVNGDVAAFMGTCALDCREPAPEPAAAPPPPPPVVRTPAPAPKPRTVRAAVPELPDLPPEKQAPKTGCSVTGCYGTSCCDASSDQCVSCPGNPCCQTGLGCGGSCQQDDDCLQGCGCNKLAGSPWGTCRAK